ncbi:Fic family protein [Promicromonospora sp. AC04]|uniref:Fic family protein n=1 Tax=Promicromonospora sp. AC04 TaxID=2135723 RepID=UPI000D378838|nr:Fic family protein [Promicromonospora sp. AC04]PUB27143.1 Fic family protein [Promicromonospora sp. AC04]
MPPAIYTTPEPDATDTEVIAEIRTMRESLADVLRVPRRWTGNLRRTTQARAIKGSNSIEGYNVTDQDAVAAVDDEEPLTADDRTWAEILGYRRVMTYVLSIASQTGFTPSSQMLGMLHFMLLEHDLDKSPGQFRTGPIYVRDSGNGETVYEAPDADLVPELVDALIESVRRDSARTSENATLLDPMVRAAMAHLNLVMIHPFRDGNGRMSRALQTMVLAQDRVLEPTFSSVEEWLGNNTDDYYRVLAATGQGSWHPENDASLWVKFNLRAHHMQAQTLRRRFRTAEETWLRLDDLVRQHKLPDRASDPLFDATLGSRVTRAGYMKRSGLEERTASRDLVRLAELGLLQPHGKTRARHYLAGPEIDVLRSQVQRDRGRLDDPYPDLPGELRKLTAS